MLFVFGFCYSSVKYSSPLSDISGKFSIVNETLSVVSDGKLATHVPLSSYIIGVLASRNWIFVPIADGSITSSYWTVVGFDGTSRVTGECSFSFLVYTP